LAAHPSSFAALLPGISWGIVLSRLAFCGCENFKLWKIAAITCGIAREQGEVSNGRVRANVKIR
jgi:hypothetical protein